MVKFGKVGVSTLDPLVICAYLRVVWVLAFASGVGFWVVRACYQPFFACRLTACDEVFAILGVVVRGVRRRLPLHVSVRSSSR